MDYVAFPMILIFVGAISSAVGAFWTAARQVKSANQRADFEKELRLKTEEIAELNKQIAANVTGGDSYCTLFVSAPGESNQSGLILMNQGKYPVYDISVKIDDVEHLIDVAKNELGSAGSWAQSRALLAKASIVFLPGNLGPGQATELGVLQLPTTEKQSYNVQITARNSYVIQTLRFRRVNGEWKRAEKIMVNGVEHEPTIDPAFPRNDKGQVGW